MAFETSLSGVGDGDAVGQGPLRSYIETINQRRRFVVLSVVVCTLAALLYVATATNQYTAHADMLITPVPSTQTGVLGLGLLRQGSDPSGDLATAARLIDNTEIASAAARKLGLRDSPAAILAELSVDPVANSSIVEVTASTSSPARSQRLANGFAAAAVQVRSQALYRVLDPAIRNLRAQIKTSTGGRANTVSGNAQALYQQLATLEALRSAPDPTIQFETPAALPTSASSPQAKLAILGGILAGLLIGIAGAFVLTALDPRQSRESGLERTGLPVLTRVPLLARGGRLARGSQPRAAFDEAFRSLRTTLRFAAGENPMGTIAVTSASEQEGKTTVAFQLAMATLEAGQSVLLVEADPFRPGLRALVAQGETPDDGPGLLEYLAESATLDDVTEQTSVPRLTFISAGSAQPASMAGLLEGRRGRSFVQDASARADVTILDCPPVGPRSDAILIATAADAVMLVVDLESSDGRQVLDTVERLRRSGARLLGIVLNRDTSPTQTYDYQEPSDSEPGQPSRRTRTLATRN